MFLIRRISTVIKSNAQYFSSSSNERKIINEMIKQVDQYSKIIIKSGINVSIRPYDLHECPDSNKIKATIMGMSHNDPTNIDITVTDKVIEIVNETDPETCKKNDLICYLEIPIKSDLEVESKSAINIADMYSDYVKAIADGNLLTKNLRSTSLDLCSLNGNVTCNGTTLAQKIDIHTKNKGNIILDKLQGDLLYCKTFEGNINVNSCYVEKSNFATENGNLNLKNIHKRSEVYVLKKGDINMSGIHGNIYVSSASGDLNLQFSEIIDDNIIMADNSENVNINISQMIEENSFIEIHSDKISLESSMSHLSKYLKTDKHFVYGQEIGSDNKLLICSHGLLKLGKMSWADSLKLTMKLKDL